MQTRRCQCRLGGSSSSSIYKRVRASARCKAGQQPICIDHISSGYNVNVSVWEVPDSPEFPMEIRKSRVLMLDHSGNMHSIYRQGQTLTGAYWDCLALLPALVPEGPLAILGLGAGTIAHLLHEFYPQRVLHGWELDPAVVMMAEQHMGMKQLTECGCLVVHVGDALADAASVGAGGAAGIIVDLFADGQLIPQLTQASSWSSIRQRLAPNGRVMTNLGAAQVSGRYGQPFMPEVATTRAALAAMAEAFDGQLTCCRLVHGNTANMVVITGPPVLSQDWSNAPAALQQYTQCSWEPWEAASR